MERGGYQPEQFQPEKLEQAQLEQPVVAQSDKETELKHELYPEEFKEIIEHPRRRRFPKEVLAATLAVFFATAGTCEAGIGIKKLEKIVELFDRKEPFSKKWQTVLDEGIEEFENNQEMAEKIGQEDIQELVAILRRFDVEEYIETLAKIGDIGDKKDINGEVLSFSLEVNDKRKAMAEVVDLRNIKLFISERMRYQGKFHEPTIHAIIRHELAHVFSCDYEAPLGQNYPLMYTKKVKDIRNRMRLPQSVYEGATEFMAIAKDLESGANRNLEQGYRGGGTLSAFALSELVGRKDFIKAYLKKDPEAIGKLLNDKFGADAVYDLMEPTIRGAGIANPFYQESLDVLHNIFTHQKEYGFDVKEILSKAGESGIREKAEHFAEDGVSLTTHLSMINDADEPPHFSFNSIGEGPAVYRFGKIKDEDGSPVLEKVGFIIDGERLSPEIQELAIKNAADMLKKRCAMEDPREIALAEAHLYLGTDDYVEERLKKLGEVDQRSGEFESLWADINQHIKELVKENLKKVYERAGVLDLIYKGDSK